MGSPNHCIRNTAPDKLYHIVLTTSNIQRDPTSEIERIRIPGTYRSLEAAKSAAHSCLFDAGYEREWFSKYEVDAIGLERYNIYRSLTPIVLAVAFDGTTFCVCICSTTNVGCLTTDNEDNRIAADLYYVVRSSVVYNDGDTGERRDINIEGAFITFAEAKLHARRALLSKENGITKESFAEYDETRDDENECGFGENVIIHAGGPNGENDTISVYKGEEMESVKLVEAAERLF